MSSEPVRLERRCGQRFQMHLTLTIQLDGRTLHGFTQDVSARGLFLFCEAPLIEGTPLELTFTMPSEITLAESMRVRCQGRVLRAAPTQTGPRNGIAVKLDSYEYLPSVECDLTDELTRVSATDPVAETSEVASR